LKIQKLDHVNVRTTNLSALIAWYTTVLELQSGDRPDFPFPGAWIYSGNQAVVHLIGIEGEPGVGSDTSLKLEHFAFSASGRKQFEEKLNSMNEQYRCSEVSDFNLVQYNLWDPDGNHIHINFPLDENLNTDSNNTGVTTYYLEMKSLQMLNEKPKPHSLEITEIVTKQPKFNQFLYQLVGQDWHWDDKDAFTEDDWKEYVEDQNLRTWVAYSRGSIVGYFELQNQAEFNVEITYFGLTPDSIGKGFGGYLLTQAIKAAWNWEGTKRVWLHTCSLDHKNALGNYQARGFEIYKESID
jgi:GNAT superfamily N-acetyltransferase/catechol 2,3-dioxygenase-like lactoylglutathione lyase family enzyme